MRLTSNILAPILVFAFALTVASRYYHYVAERDFALVANTACDPRAHACFVASCEPGRGCDLEPYEKVEVLAKGAPACFEEHSCTDFTCGGRRACSITYCTPAVLAEGEVCTAGGPTPSP